MSVTPVPLCIADDSSFWPWITWADFADRTHAAATTVIVPVAGLADWGLGHAYDAEEQILTRILQVALAGRPAHAPRVLMLPPLRFVIGAGEGSVCAVDAPTAHAYIDETLASVAAAGFTRIVLCNASPWNEELCDVAARDIRISRGLQMFCINLSALDLDFHPARSTSRRKVQTVLTYLTGRAPETVDNATPARSPRLPGDESVTPLDVPAATPAEAAQEAPAVIAAAAKRLAALLQEIADRPPLPRNGAWGDRTYP
jgi:creatinine amidohydrolase/Fe(II)-dependent formamide hydrolase-like protein